MSTTEQKQVEQPSFATAVKFWLKLGFISFGGPAGQIAIMHEYLVDKKKWISESRFLHALNYCMILPGPEAQQLATYIGWLLHGTKGGLAAGILFVLPSMLIILGLSIAYVLLGNVPWVYSIFDGLKPAVIAIVMLALIKIARKSLSSTFHYLIAIAAFISIFFFNAPFPLIIAASIILSIAVRRFMPNHISYGKQSGPAQEDESSYFLNKHTVIPNIGFNSGRFWRQIIVGIFLWLIPITGCFLLAKAFSFWQLLAVFFTKAALVTFGGAYAVLPYVAQVSVEKYQWLTKLQMIDGLALGETTPGPLIIVLSFVGFMSAYNQFNHSLWLGTAGLGLTTFYTFLPSFLFIFIGAPIIERTQQNKQVKEVLALVSAAVVGVVLNLTIYLGKAVLFPKTLSLHAVDYLALGWVIISFLAMYRFKAGMIPWIAASAAFGLVRYFVVQQ